jgi:hypothetical protein
MRSASQVAPSAVPHGKQAAGMPSKNLVPRTPLGPSDMRTEGIFSRGTGAVCQKSIPFSIFSSENRAQTLFRSIVPDSKEIFSLMYSSEMAESTSINFGPIMIYFLIKEQARNGYMKEDNCNEKRV